MTIKKLLPSLLLSLTLFVPTHPSVAQDVREKLDNDVLSQMQSEGWRIVKSGVLQRELRAGEVESFVFGSDGFLWKLQDLRGRLRKMQAEFNAHPTPELRQAIAGYRKEIASTQKMIELARAAEALGETGIEKVSCSLNFAYDASASYGTSAQGTYGNASANFTGNCGFTGQVYATAYSKVTVNGAPTTKTVTDGPRSGANVSASAYASLNGGSVCESTAYASMTSSSLNPTSYSMSASNTQCPLPQTPPTISLAMSPASSSTAPLQLYDYDCVTITWTATSSTGTATFYRNNVSQGSSTSYSEMVCNQGINTLQTIAVYATATNSAGTATSATKTAYIQHHTVYVDPPDNCPTGICP